MSSENPNKKKVTINDSTKALNETNMLSPIKQGSNLKQTQFSVTSQAEKRVGHSAFMSSSRRREERNEFSDMQWVVCPLCAKILTLYKMRHDAITFLLNSDQLKTLADTFAKDFYMSKIKFVFKMYSEKERKKRMKVDETLRHMKLRHTMKVSSAIGSNQSSTNVTSRLHQPTENQQRRIMLNQRSKQSRDFTQTVESISQRKVVWEQLEPEEKKVLRAGSKDLKRHYSRYGL